MREDPKRPTFFRRNGLLLRAFAVAVAALALKWVMHAQDWELVSVSPLFSAIVAADVFLMGFLLSGVWSDYKESEKLPGELASSLEALADEAVSIRAVENPARGTELLAALSELSHTIEESVRRRRQTEQLMERLERINELCFGLHDSVR